jgi:hypothetical protein
LEEAVVPNEDLLVVDHDESHDGIDTGHRNHALFVMALRL